MEENSLQFCLGKPLSTTDQPGIHRRKFLNPPEPTEASHCMPSLGMVDSRTKPERAMMSMQGKRQGKGERHGEGQTREATGVSRFPRKARGERDELADKIFGKVVSTQVLRLSRGNQPL